MKKPPSCRIPWVVVPTWYDIRGLMILKLAYKDSLLRQVRYFSGNLQGSHLEVAIGSGSLLWLCLLYLKFRRRSRELGSLTGIDLDSALVRRARSAIPWGEIRVESGEKIDAADESFDTINISNAFHCFEAPLAVLRECRRVLRPAGALRLNVLLVSDHPISQCVNRWGIRKGILSRPYLIEECTRIFAQAGFRVEREEQDARANSAYFLLRPDSEVKGGIGPAGPGSPS